MKANIKASKNKQVPIKHQKHISMGVHKQSYGKKNKRSHSIYMSMQRYPKQYSKHTQSIVSSYLTKTKTTTLFKTYTKHCIFLTKPRKYIVREEITKRWRHRPFGDQRRSSQRFRHRRASLIHHPQTVGKRRSQALDTSPSPASSKS